MQAIESVVFLDDSTTAFNAGRLTGRVFAALFIPVLVIAFVYWGTGRSRQPPMAFSHAISRWWVWVGGLAAGLVVLVAQSIALVTPALLRQAALEATTSAVPKPSAPVGWTMQRDPRDGFELALPDTWVYARTDPAYFEADVANVKQANPDAADALRRLRDAGKGIGVKLLTLDPATRQSGYYTNLFVVTYDAGLGASLDSEVNDYVKGVQENASVQKPVVQRNTTIPVGPAVRVEAHNVGPGLSQVSYLMLHAKNGRSETVVLIFSYASDQLSATETIISQVVESFRYVS